MRTKALILIAVLTAASVATSMAQVYSVNAVGYVNLTIQPKLNLIANPLIAATNTLNALFPPASMPSGLSFYKFNTGTYGVSSIDEFTGEWTDNGNNQPNGDTETLVFGDGCFLNNPLTTPFTLTFVGEVAQGNPVSNPVPPALSIKSSKVPQAGLITTDLGYQPGLGDSLFKFNPGPSQNYSSYTFDEFGGGWINNGSNMPEEPTLGIGEAAFFQRVSGTTWTRNFTVN